MEKENVIKIVQCLRQIADILENENAPKDLFDEESFIKQEESPKKSQDNGFRALKDFLGLFAVSVIVKNNLSGRQKVLVLNHTHRANTGKRTLNWSLPN